GPKDSEGDAGMNPTEVDERGASDKNENDAQDTRSESLNQREMQTEHTNSINTVSTAGPSFDNVVRSPPVNTVGPSDNNTGIFGNAYDDEDLEEEVDMNNVISSYSVPDTSFTKFHKDHPEDQLRRTNQKDFQNCMFACLLSQMEPKKPVQALKEPSLVEAMQDELLQFKLLKVWTLVDLPRDKLVAQGHTQEEGIDYDKVFALVARIEAIRLFLAYASFKKFVVYQMDVKSAFLYGKIEEEGQIDTTLFIKRHKDDLLLVQVYVDDFIFGSTKKELSTEFEKLMHDKFQMSSMCHTPPRRKREA
ncbi:putative ribonuclease H-like domain-containing protein, partial [Tanacetum coccineum]